MPTPSSAGKENNGATAYGRWTMAFKWLRYYFTASSGKGHGIHSPLVFDFVRTVLGQSYPSESFRSIEVLRKKMLKDRRIIEVEDFGAGSVILKGKRRSIASVASTSLKHPRYSRLMYHLAARYRPDNVLELGTSLGITTAYMATARPSAKIITVEGSAAIAGMASANFKALQLTGVQLKLGKFDEKLEECMKELGRVDLAYIDGDHRLRPTLDYFERILPFVRGGSVLVFDDIHWSPQMESAWEVIKSNPAVRLTIDVFFMGIVFFSPDIQVKQHFTLRY